MRSYDWCWGVERTNGDTFYTYFWQSLMGTTMNKIEWSDSFSVGVELFDEQHKTIISMINKLIETPNINTNSAIITALLTGMIEYAAEHFADEERLMRQHDYPDYSDQRTQHGDFIERTAEFCSDGRLQVDSIPESILVYLRQWWVDHILKEDIA